MPDRETQRSGSLTLGWIAERHDATGDADADWHAIECLGQTDNSRSLDEEQHAGVSVCAPHRRADEGRSVQQLRRMPMLRRHGALELRGELLTDIGGA